MAPLRAPLCISRGNDLRHLSARLLDRFPRGATRDRRCVLCNRAGGCSRGAVPSPLRLPRGEYSLAEAFLWLGIYLAINLKLSPLNFHGLWVLVGRQLCATINKVVLLDNLGADLVPAARRTRPRDSARKTASSWRWARSSLFLTFVSNKPYLGWPRHTWDPMLLGILLTGVAFFLRRWLARGPGGVRDGFTAARLSGKDKQWMGVGSTVAGLLSPQPPAPQPMSGLPFWWRENRWGRRQRRFLKTPAR